ncbi:hypothetical protein [Streptomyces sp. NPDC050738]|uniref:hypothetical protein n=1 Tax=Streptomyces sp. NPDC050738 TaxID=3154744 RepID=UPI00341C299A
MNPTTPPAPNHAPWQPPQPPRSGRTALTVLAAVLWMMTMTAVAWFALVVALNLLTASETGDPAGAMALQFVTIVVGGAAVLLAVAFAPGVRRLSPEARLVLLGCLAWSVPAVLLVSGYFG